MPHKTFPADFLASELVSCSISPAVPGATAVVQSLWGRAVDVNLLAASWQGEIEFDPIPLINEGSHPDLQRLQEQVLPFLSFAQIPGNTFDIDIRCVSPRDADRNPKLFAVPAGTAFVRSSNARTVQGLTAATSAAVGDPFVYLLSGSKARQVKKGKPWRASRRRTRAGLSNRGHKKNLTFFTLTLDNTL